MAQKKATSTSRTSKSAPATKKSTAKKVTAKKVASKKATVQKTVLQTKLNKKVAEVSATAKTKKPSTPISRLRTWNWWLAFLHAAQGVAVVLLAKDVTFPVTTSYLTTDSLASTAEQPVLVSATRNLWDVNLGYVVAAFFFMSAIAHLSIATWYRKKYEKNLENGINKARWFEYAASASTMMIAIAMIAGIADLSTLLLMFGATAVMNFCGLVMELANQRKDKVDWTSYWVGCLAGILPWIAYVIYVYGSERYGEGGGPPTFVYFILVSIFLFFNSFAFNMWLQYKKKGRWADYLYGERTYMILSLLAKSALAWQVFAGTLRP
jgi:hypothetical protein